MERDARALQIYEQASELSESQRDAYVNAMCGGDAELLSYVGSLLATESEARGFLEPTGSYSPGPNQASPPSCFTKGAVLCQRYSVVEQVGSGGMGSVYHATDSQLARSVAIKVLNQAGPPGSEARQRFEREIRSVAALSHPNLVTLYDIADHDGVPLAVMEYVEGKTLRDWSARPVSLRSTLKVARDIAKGLDAAHRQGLMHRDIKPENIVVSPDGVAKVLDFGLARAETLIDGQSLTRTDHAPGTPPYMSPEQVRSESIGCSTDIFSLGTVLFELLAGEHPFRRQNAFVTMQRISDGPTPDLTDPTGAFPAGLAKLVASMLDRNSNRRPTASEICQRLGSLLTEAESDGLLVGGPMLGGVTPGARDSLTRLEVEPPTNLPISRRSLTGRDAELMDLAEQLENHPAVTVVGAGGVGKTSLAYEAARLARKEYPGGVWLCELAPLRSSDGVLETLSSAIDGNAGAVNPLDEVIARLQGDPALLLFDNCEHVIDATADLISQLSRRLPNLAVLATSREALGVAEERVVRLDGLTTEDAANLFVTRAIEQGAYRQESTHADLVDQIVDQLDGLPLAIELAASKTAAMSLSELLEALDNQPAVLRTGRRPSDRQATIEQAIAWSFDLLTGEEQQALLSLSVFASWFTIDAARRVSNIGTETTTRITRLVEQSVVSRKEHRGQSRYRLLEPIRQFCKARISQEQLAPTEERHAHYYAKRANQLARGISGFDEIACSHALNDEWADMRSAFAWGRRNHAAGIAADPLVALSRMAMFHLRIEAFRWLLDAETELGALITNRPGVDEALATGHWLMGDEEAAETHLEHARSRGVTALTAWTEFIIRGGQARFAEAFEQWESFQRLTASGGDEIDTRWAGCAYAAHMMAMIDPHAPGLDQLLEEIAQRQALIDWPTGDALLHGVRANLALMRGLPDEAVHHRELAVGIATDCGSRFIEIFCNALISSTDNGSSSQTRQRLAAAFSDFKVLSESHGALQMPMAARSIIVAMIGCGEMESAARCSTIVESLAGLGANGEYSHDYPPALESLRESLGRERFAQLRKEGEGLPTTHLLEVVEAVLTSTP